MATRTTPEYAAFANGVMIRYLDYNDTYHARGGSGHPSDLLGAILAVAEPQHASGRQFLLGLHTAYEVFCGNRGCLSGVRPRMGRRLNIEIATAASAAKLMNLSPEQTANAISLAMTPNIPLGVTRAGELSHWKGCACGYASMAGLFAARMAQEGMTGPARPFEGVRALFHRVTPPFELNAIGEPRDGRSAIERCHIKLFPADYETQAPIAAMIALRRNGLGPEDIEAINIRTYHLAWYMMGGGQGDADEKWDPKTRETADHSFPYMVAVALMDGDVSVDSFSLERIADPALRPLMRKITIEKDAEIEANWVKDPAHQIEGRAP